MSKRRAFLIRLLLIIVVIGCLTHTSWGQGNGIVNISHPSSLPAGSAFSDEDILNHAHRSLDRSISILNTVATLMGALVALLTLIIVIGSALGFLEYRRWQEFKQQAKESAEETKRYADEARKAAEEARPIIDKLKKAEEEIDTFRERAKHLPSLLEPFSEDQKRLLDEYGKKIEFLEAFGVPLKSEDYFNRGVDFYQREKYELALKAYDKVIELKPDYATAWHNRGFALDELGRHEEALKAYDKAIELKSDYVDAWYNHEEALKAYDKAIELKPDYADAWYNRGFALGKLGRYEEELKAYDKAIELKPDDVSAWTNRGVALDELGRYEEALKAFDKAIELKVHGTTRLVHIP
jgi:tetratricopeptide (TPR) repeat protein